MGRKNRNARTRAIPDYSIEALSLPMRTLEPEVGVVSLAFLPAISFAPLVLFLVLGIVGAVGL